jgi:hypothetical protein
VHQFIAPCRTHTDIFNHANMYAIAAGADANGQVGGVVIQGKKGGLGPGNAEGLSHEERRFC